jgi:hypothetical protein
LLAEGGKMPKKANKEEVEDIGDEKVIAIGDEPGILSNDLDMDEDSDEEELEDFEGE